MKAIVYRLTQGSTKQFEIGEDADKNVIGYFAEMYAGWASWDVEETESSIQAVMAFLHNAQHGTYAREYDLHDPKRSQHSGKTWRPKTASMTHSTSWHTLTHETEATC